MGRSSSSAAPTTPPSPAPTRCPWSAPSSCAAPSTPRLAAARRSATSSPTRSSPAPTFLRGVLLLLLRLLLTAPSKLGHPSAYIIATHAYYVHVVPTATTASLEMRK